MNDRGPGDEKEQRQVMKTAFEAGQPTSLRYRRGNGVGVKLDAELKALPIGKGEVMREGNAAAIFAIGGEVWPAINAAEMLAKEGVNVAVINGRFIKPLDDELIARFCKPNAKIITVEEGSLAGGFGSAVMERVQQLGIDGVKFHRIGIPDEYVHHGSQAVRPHESDPPWTKFVGHSEITGYEAMARVRLGAPDPATRPYHAVPDHPARSPPDPA